MRFDVRLVSRFRYYWELVLERQRNQPDIPMPFHALGSDRDRIWQRFTADGQRSKAKATTRLCSLDPDLFIIRVALGRFTESSPHGRLLATFHHRPLHFHEHARLRPAAEPLQWHWRERFAGI
ncbi:MAG: hypothetical protein JJT96_17040 [Opitutales bacterium]|nr:hypothetical protein [Opitutales bacterium]